MKKEKIEYLYDNLIYNIRHIRGNIRKFISGLKRWFSYFKVLINVYDFDYFSILEVERHQIIRVRNNIAKYQNYEDFHRDVQRMDLALKLLDIIEENGCSELNGPGFITKPCNNGLSELVPDSSSKWTIPVYVNTTNSERFHKVSKDNFEDPRIGDLMKDSLRIEKAWYLYNKLRLYWLRSWWD